MISALTYSRVDSRVMTYMFKVIRRVSSSQTAWRRWCVPGRIGSAWTVRAALCAPPPRGLTITCSSVTAVIAPSTSSAANRLSENRLKVPQQALAPHIRCDVIHVCCVTSFTSACLCAGYWMCHICTAETSSRSATLGSKFPSNGRAKVTSQQRNQDTRAMCASPGCDGSGNIKSNLTNHRRRVHAPHSLNTPLQPSELGVWLTLSSHLIGRRRVLSYQDRRECGSNSTRSWRQTLTVMSTQLPLLTDY